MERIFGRGVIINVVAGADADPNYGVSIADVKKWEAKHGKIPPGAAVLMNSGWYKRYPNQNRVWKSSTPMNISTHNFPGFLGATTKWLVEERKIHILGSDSPSTDDGNAVRDYSFGTHRVAAQNNIIGIENLANLDAVPEAGSIIYVPVPKTLDGSGGPTRVFATYDDAMNGANTAVNFFGYVTIMTFIFAFNL